MRQPKRYLGTLFALLALLFYATSLLSQTTKLPDTFFDIMIYTVYFLLVSVLSAITFISYLMLGKEAPHDVSIGCPVEMSETMTEVPLPKDDPIAVHHAEPFRVAFVAAQASLGLPREKKGFMFLASQEIEETAAYFTQQHPQITAAVILMCDVEHVEQLLQAMSVEYREEVVRAVQQTKQVSDEALRTLEDALQRELFSLQKDCTVLHDLDNEKIRALLRRIDKKELIVALKGATQELQEKFFANMSPKALHEFKNILDTFPEIETSKRQKAVKKLALLAEQLRENGKIRAINNGHL